MFAEQWNRRRQYRSVLLELKELLAYERVEWVFIPPRAPHWGGLWERGIKSTKYHLHRWKLVRQMYQSFWKRWQREYLSQVQSRSKRTKEQKNLQVGDPVLVMEDSLPPTNSSFCTLIGI